MDWKILIIAICVLGAFYGLKRMSFVSAGKAHELLREGALVVDVREPIEFETGHLPGALNIPLGDLKSELPRRQPDKNRVVLLHCLSGGRSGIARRQVQTMGYTAFNLGSYSRAGGIVRKAREEPGQSRR
jgi:phage shock protein E